MHNILETDSQKEHFIYHIYCVKVCTLSIKANYFRDTVGENNYTALCETVVWIISLRERKQACKLSNETTGLKTVGQEIGICSHFTTDSGKTLSKPSKIC